MRKWWIDFQGYCLVEGEDREHAENTFFEHIYPAMEGPIYNEVYEVTGMEMVEPEAKQLSMFDTDN
jgi:hypothetical protein